MLGSLFLAGLMLISGLPALPEPLPGTAAAREQPAETSGPIRRAIARDAGRLAIANPAQVIHVYPRRRPRLAPSDWSRVARLEPGTEIDLATLQERLAHQRVLYVDNAELTVLDTSHPSLPEAARKRLVDLATLNPLLLMRTRVNATCVLDDHGRIEPDGLFYGGQKLFESSEIVRTFPRHDVVQVSRFKKVGSGWGALAGGIVGSIVGTQLGVTLAFKQCGGSCSDEKALMALSLIGLPIGAGVLGYHVVRRDVDVIGFRMHTLPPPRTDVPEGVLLKR